MATGKIIFAYIWVFMTIDVKTKDSEPLVGRIPRIEFAMDTILTKLSWFHVSATEVNSIEHSP
jgi:hypothetical protein